MLANASIPIKNSEKINLLLKRNLPGQLTVVTLKLKKLSKGLIVLERC